MSLGIFFYFDFYNVYLWVIVWLLPSHVPIYVSTGKSLKTQCEDENESRDISRIPLPTQAPTLGKNLEIEFWMYTIIDFINILLKDIS